MPCRFWFLALCLSVLCALGFSSVNAAADGPVSIGVIMGLTGPMAPVAEEMRRGMQLAAREHQEKLKLIFEDDHGMESKDAVSALIKLTSMDNTQLVLNWVNTTMPALVPIAERKEVPLLEFWDHNHGMLRMGQYVFCSGVSTEGSGEVMAEFIQAKRGQKKIAVISANDPWSEVLSKAFIEKYKAIGGSVVFSDSVNPDQEDVKSVLLKAKASGAEGLFLPIYLKPLYSAIKHSRELGFRGSIYTTDGFMESDIQVVGEPAEGVYSLQTMVQHKEFSEKYAKEYGKARTSTALGYAALAYDGIGIAAHVIAEIQREGRVVTGEEIANRFRPMRYEGITGTAVLFGQAVKRESVVVVRNGQFELVPE